MANSISVAEHRDLGMCLDVLHERIGAAWDDKVNDIIQSQELINAIAACDKTDESGIHIRCECLGKKQLE